MALLLLVLGCGNPCQSLCETMASRATECNLALSETELESCSTRYEEVTPEQSAACDEANDPERLEEWWTCEELAENYTNGVK